MPPRESLVQSPCEDNSWLALYRVSHIWSMGRTHVYYTQLLPNVGRRNMASQSHVFLPLPLDRAFQTQIFIFSILDLGQLPLISALSPHHLS